MKNKNILICVCLITVSALVFFSDPQACAGQAGWTVMVYMAGENNLAQSLEADLEEMKAVGSSQEVNIIVQADTGLSPLFSFGDGHTHRFKVNRGGLKDYPMGYNADMASPQELSSFISWAVSHFPADRYCLILWDHGLGWAGGEENGEPDSDQAASVRGILEDSGSNSFMSLSELALALSDAGVRFDLIEFDACLMGMWEVAVSVRDWASYITFSQATEPATGNPYDRILSDLTASPWIDGREFSERMVDDFLAYYHDSFTMDVSVTKSAIDTSRVQELSSEINHLAALLNASFSELRDSLVNIRQDTQAYPELPGSIDLVDFVAGLEDSADGDIQSAAGYMKTLLLEHVVIRHGFLNAKHASVLAGSSDLSGSSGISIFLPLGTELLPGELEEYGKIQAVSEAPEWYSFMKRFSEDTGPGQEAEAAEGGFLFGIFWNGFPGGYSGADLDLYVIEPDGVYAPWTGHVSPNGYFSLDSYVSNLDLEFYKAKPVVRKGYYIPVINYQAGLFESWPRGQVAAYFYYIPEPGAGELYQWGPRYMSLLNPAPASWDDDVIELLSQNYYSDWWIPTGIERFLSRASAEAKRSFWGKVIKAKKRNMTAGGYKLFRPSH